MSDSDEDHVEQPRAQHGHHREHDDQVRERHPGVHHPLDDEVVDAAEVAAGDAERGGHQGGQPDGGEAHGDRHARAVDDPAPHVAAEVVGAQPVGGAGRLHAGAADRLVVAVGRDPLGEGRHEQHGHHEDAPDGPQRLSPREPQGPSRRPPGPPGRRAPTAAAAGRTSPARAQARPGPRSGEASEGGRSPPPKPSSGFAGRGRRRARPRRGSSRTTSGDDDEVHALDHRVVALVDGVEEEAAHARQTEDRLDDHRAPQDLRDLGAEQR